MCSVRPRRWTRAVPQLNDWFTSTVLKRHFQSWILICIISWWFSCPFCCSFVFYRLILVWTGFARPAYIASGGGGVKLKPGVPYLIRYRWANAEAPLDLIYIHMTCRKNPAKTFLFLAFFVWASWLGVFLCQYSIREVFFYCQNGWICFWSAIHCSLWKIKSFHAGNIPGGISAAENSHQSNLEIHDIIGLGGSGKI